MDGPTFFSSAKGNELTHLCTDPLEMYRQSSFDALLESSLQCIYPDSNILTQSDLGTIDYKLSTAPLPKGYAAVGTSAGFYTSDIFGGDANTWALPSPGKANMRKIEDFAYRSLAEMVSIGKEAVKKFYGEAPEYSFFSGCSGAGR
ncbi:hypothetical protein DE146DRAFT_630903 [Phaeosphaeria sp. MPI-PUGE-AT-0046c]|nr:hypothetical protein DE146DRAFT_630903 [Phaeosphaeria sp. MPI-PUGE-AT-0046c]